MRFYNKKIMTRAVSVLLAAVVLLGCIGGAAVTVGAAERDIRLIPGGVPFGVKLYAQGVSVVGVGTVECTAGTVSPARDAGIRENDVILEINGRAVSIASEVSDIVGTCGGNAVTLTVLRGDERFTVDITPVLSSEDGRYRAGLLIKDGTAGIGTVTYIDPSVGSFAGLGHGICENGTDELAPLVRGAVVNVTISGVVKGKAGVPGELKGYFSSGKIGTLLGNTECGVYGYFADYPTGICNEAVEVASSTEVCDGDAELWCTTDEAGVGKYTVHISDIDRSGRSVKNFVVTVTDPVLLEKTGGIVQGM